ncbi:hypothetical protein GH714_002309 [Hevea brasiliensis]|uniref:VQ domain-containing protein n=1 Tax=Hevea brasiliensis TaxID=3981 RepID=A0A6A6KHY8_HEVBR|nr:hypothetical protein GH714_002309 [Hevea brasiliensis]
MRRKPIKHKKKPVKITYISNPTMFRATNALEFRAIVQQLTGKDSKVLDAWDRSEEATQVPDNYKPERLKIDNVSVDDVFSSYTSSSSVEMEDSLFWREEKGGKFVS